MSIFTDAYNYGKDLVTGGYNGVKNAAIDIFSADTAKAEKPTPDMWQNDNPAIREQIPAMGGLAAGNIATAGTAARDTATGYGTVLAQAAQGANATQQNYAQNFGSMSANAAGYLSSTPQSYTNPGIMSGFNSLATSAAGYAPSADSSAAVSGLLGVNGQPGAAQQGLGSFQSRAPTASLGNTYSALMRMGYGGGSDSVAQQQLQQGQANAIAGQLALAQSARGAGAGANAQRDAAATIQAMQSRSALDAANLRSAEDQQAIQNQLAAFGQAGNIAGTIQGAQSEADAQRLAALQAAAQGEQQLSAQQIQALSAAGGLAGSQDQNRLAALQAAAGITGQAADYGLQGQTAADQNRLAWAGQQSDAMSAAASNALAGNQALLSGLGKQADLGLQGAEDALQASQAAEVLRGSYMDQYYNAYEQDAQRKAGLYGSYLSGQTQASIANQQADLQKDSSYMMGMGSLIGGLGALSDRRAKENIRYADVLSMFG